MDWFDSIYWHSVKNTICQDGKMPRMVGFVCIKEMLIQKVIYFTQGFANEQRVSEQTCYCT